MTATTGPDRASVADIAATVVAGRTRRRRRRLVVVLGLTVAVMAVFWFSLQLGRTYYGPGEVLGVLLGREVQGASFTVGTLRLPRAVTAVLTGLSFGIAGATFQTMLRNPLASPDFIGISAGAGTVAVIGIVVLSLSPTTVSLLATAGALVTAAVIYALSFRGGVVGTRLILIGIGIAAMLDSVTSYVLSRAAQWDLQTATRWLTGNLNGASFGRVWPLVVAALVLIPVLLHLSRNLETMRLGDQASTALGVPVERTRILLIVAAVTLLAFATAAAGPIAFVAFLSGPIAARILGPNGSVILPAGLVGALLVLLADFVGQYAFGNRFPVGVVTGALGAPFLVYLLIRTNRAGGSL